MISQPAPTTIEHGACTTPERIAKVEMIEPGERIKPAHITAVTLLPIDPPEINALVFHRVMEEFKISLDECFVRGAELDGFAIARVLSKTLGKLRIDFLMFLNALRRMQ